MARTIGMEIETGCDDWAPVVGGIRSRGVYLETTDNYATGERVDQWTAKPDGSVDGMEIVSPPFEFASPFWRDELRKVCEGARSGGARPHSSAGIHVHVDVSDLPARNVASIVKFVHKFEDFLYRIASAGWQTIRSGAATYAKPIHPNLAHAMYRVRSAGDLERAWSGVDRYHAVNLHSYFFRGTVEFRIFNSSLNPDRIASFVALCHGIVEDATRHSRSLSSVYPVGGMASGATDERALLLRLQQILTCYDRDTSAPMLHADWQTLRRTCWQESRPQVAESLARW